MATGRKNYFRHNVNARKDRKIVELIVGHGKAPYFHFFALLEMCAEQALDHPVTPRKFRFHRRTVCSELYISNAHMEGHLAILKEEGLIDFELDETTLRLVIPSLPKHLGKYNKHKGGPVAETPPHGNKQAKRTPEQRERARKIKEAYIAAFKERYGIRPTFSKKEHTLVYTLMERIGHAEGLTVAANYPFYNDPWHLGKKHPFGMLISDLDKVRVELRDPRRMLDKRRAEKQIDEADETVEYEEKKRHLKKAIAKERGRQITE